MSEKQSQLRHEAELTYEVADDESPSEGVVAAVADASNADPAELNPLATYIEPDALDALFEDRYDGTPRAAGGVTFRFCEYDVTVCSDGRISILARSR